MQMAAAAVAVGLLVTSLGSAAAAQEAPSSETTLNDILVRDELIAAQESLLNVYRCMFNIDTHIVDGGCIHGQPRGGAIEPREFRGTPTLSDIDVRNGLIAAQESLLNVYRCMFNIDTQVVPGGCVGRQPSESAPVPISPRASGCGATVPGTRVDYAMFSPNSSLDPTMSAGSLVGGTQLASVWDVLMTFDSETGEYQPRVAESLIPNHDFTEWTLKIPSGIAYGNGDAFVAQDVIDSLRRFQDGRRGGVNNPARHYLQLVDFRYTRATDDNTAVFALTRPWATFPLVLADEPGMIVNPRVVARLLAEEADNADDQNSVERLVRNRLSASPGLVNAASFGPYEVVRMEPGVRTLLRARNDYWAGPVCIETIDFTFPGSPKASWEAFQAGRSNAAFLRDALLLEDARFEGVELLTELQNAGGVFLINHGVQGRDTIGQDIRIRQAMHHAIDRDAINQRALTGAATTTNALAHKGTLLWSPELQECADRSPAYNPDAAAALVKEVQEETRQDVSLLFVSTDQYPNPTISEELRSMLWRAGLDVTVAMGSIAEVLIPRVLVVADYEAAAWGHVMDGATWVTSLNWNYHSQGATNRGAYSHPDMDAALENLYTAHTLDQQRAALAEVQCVWSEQLPSMIWSANEEGLILARNIKGVQRTVSSIFLFGDAYIQN